MRSSDLCAERLLFITGYPNRVSKVVVCQDAITNADELRFQRDCTIWQR